MIKKSNLGITLIALVITIIVLLILAGVTLGLTLGENGLLKRAEESKNAHLAGEKNEIESMNSAYEYMNPYFGESENKGLTEEEKMALENNGIMQLKKDEITNPNLKDNENIKGVITGEVPIPKEAEYKEGTKETGVVVAFNDNEFVWVPVPEISEMARLQNNSNVNYQGILYNFSADTATEKTNYGIGTTSFREPDALTTYDGNATNLAIVNNILGTEYTIIDDFKTVLQTDYNEMISSVIKYKGFFIGRYETSLDENKKAKSKAGVLPATEVTTSGNTWYGLYAYQKNMAKDNNLTNVKSHMMWGSNYDIMLKWALTGADATKVTTTGNAAHNLSSVYEAGKETVAGKVDRINNVYDLEGNGYERTAEAYRTIDRSFRSGNYSNNYSPRSRSDNTSPTFPNSSFCSRLVLYIN